jgi:hypothetical protein
MKRAVSIGGNMEKTTVKKFRWFWVWQDEAEESWLDNMSQKGYHLLSVSLPGFYTFLKAEPRNYVYRLDYQTFHKKDKEEYMQLFRDAGWEYIGEMSSWQYFRKETKPGGVTEIFTDFESKITKYKRVLTYIGFFYFILIILFTDLIYTGPVRWHESYPWWGSVPQAIIFLVLLLFTYAIIRLAIRMRQLKKLRG